MGRFDHLAVRDSDSDSSEDAPEPQREIMPLHATAGDPFADEVAAPPAAGGGGGSVAGSSKLLLSLPNSPHAQSGTQALPAPIYSDKTLSIPTARTLEATGTQVAPMRSAPSSVRDGPHSASAGSPMAPSDNMKPASAAGSLRSLPSRTPLSPWMLTASGGAADNANLPEPMQEQQHGMVGATCPAETTSNEDHTNDATDAASSAASRADSTTHIVRTRDALYHIDTAPPDPVVLTPVSRLTPHAPPLHAEEVVARREDKKEKADAGCGLFSFCRKKKPVVVEEAPPEEGEEDAALLVVEASDPFAASVDASIADELHTLRASTAEASHHSLHRDSVEAASVHSQLSAPQPLLGDHRSVPEEEVIARGEPVAAAHAEDPAEGAMAAAASADGEARAAATPKNRHKVRRRRHRKGHDADEPLSAHGSEHSSRTHRSSEGAASQDRSVTGGSHSVSGTGSSYLTPTSGSGSYTEDSASDVTGSSSNLGKGSRRRRHQRRGGEPTETAGLTEGYDLLSQSHDRGRISPIVSCSPFRHHDSEDLSRLPPYQRRMLLDQRAREQRELEELAKDWEELTFHPKIHPSPYQNIEHGVHFSERLSKSPGTTPPTEHLPTPNSGAMMMPSKLTNEKPPTFHPVISPYAQAHGGREGCIFDRLSAPRKAPKTPDLSEDYTFSPDIIDYSRGAPPPAGKGVRRGHRLPRRSQSGNSPVGHSPFGDETVFERLYRKRRTPGQSPEISPHRPEKRFSFQPNITAAARRLSNDEEFGERLYKQSPRRNTSRQTEDDSLTTDYAMQTNLQDERTVITPSSMTPSRSSNNNNEHAPYADFMAPSQEVILAA